MSAATPVQEEFVAAELAVVASRFAIGTLLWGVALALVDRTTAVASDPYVANTRLALWLFLTETLVALYYVRYSTPTSYPLHKRAAFIVAEATSQAWSTGIYVALNLVVRWVVVTLLTALAVYLFGTGRLTRVAAVFPSAAFVIAALYGISSTAMPTLIRGTHIGSYLEATARAAAITLGVRTAFVERLRDQGISPQEIEQVEVWTCPFGGVLLPWVALGPHYLFVGTTGSGKTLCLRMVLGAGFRQMAGEKPKHRAIIYDGKREYFPILTGMGIPASSILILNPADARCVAWDLARDVHNRDDAVNITNLLIPEDKKGSENPFFPLAVRALIAGVMVALHELSPGKWRLIDLVNAVRTPELLKAVLGTSVEGRELVQRYFTQADEAVGGIISTIDARFISQYETIARIWARCQRSMSVTEWVKGRSILLLGYDANSQAVDLINQAIFQRAAQLVCALPDDDSLGGTQTWVVLDEVRFTGKLPKLPELISFGRTKRAHVVLAPQDLDGLIDVYGEQQANEMLALCDNVGVLRLTSVKTRKWAADFFGDAESWETDVTDTTSRGGGNGPGGGNSNWSQSRATTTRRVKRESVLPSEFLNLPLTSRQNGLHGFFSTPSMGAWRAEIPGDFIDAHLTPKDAESPAFIPRADDAVDPVRWTTADEERFTKPKPKPNEAPLPSDAAPGTVGDGQGGNPAQGKPPRDEKKDGGHDPLPEW